MNELFVEAVKEDLFSHSAVFYSKLSQKRSIPLKFLNPKQKRLRSIEKKE